MKIGNLILVVTILTKYTWNISEPENLLKHENFQWAFAFSKLAIETLKQGMKYVQSYELRHQNDVNDVKI